ncbi:MAG: hypothetical protein CMJ27_09035 [Phycisphaerae bacterium]|nr:hypothetical protein [Phycisphaerae bacterium]OUX01089.1 MAG: hypothetical protein CBD91_05275 [Phycisphaeraceae bacterium TMED231]
MFRRVILPCHDLLKTSQELPRTVTPSSPPPSGSSKSPAENRGGGSADHRVAGPFRSTLESDHEPAARTGPTLGRTENPDSPPRST